MAERYRAEHRASEMVRTRSEEMAKLSRAYQTELKDHADQLGLLKSEIKEGTVTLVYGRAIKSTMKRLS